MSDNSNLLRVASMLPMDPRHIQLLTDSAYEIESKDVEIKRLRKALKFYAGESVDMSMPPDSGVVVSFLPGDDGGWRAREALKESE